MRITLARSLLRLGRFVQSLAVVVMRPEELIRFSRRSYSTPATIAYWCRDEQVDSGLHPEEKALLEKIPPGRGRCLLLGLGGGREAVALVRLGFEVTGVDFVHEMVKEAVANCRRRGAEIEGLVQEISALDVPDGSYDIAWLTSGMYSSLPTRKRRIEMLTRVRRALKPGGHFLCGFHWGIGMGSRKGDLVRKVIAFLTLGNISFERGDMLYNNSEFVHGFSHREALVREFEKGGFELFHLFIPEKRVKGAAVLGRI